MIENNPNLLNGPIDVATLLWSLSLWAGDPAVLTAIASLLTAIAAFFRTRRRRAGRPVVQTEAQQSGAALSQAHKTLHEVEERIREELLMQLRNLREETETIGQDLSKCRKAYNALKDALVQCRRSNCPTRTSLRQEL